MTTEDYVSFEVAKLLKEKGFNNNLEKCYRSYNGKETEVFKSWYKTFDYYVSNFIQRPTLQMAMKWLREIRKINIEIFTYWSIQEKAVYGNRIVSVEHANVFKEIDIAYSTYEEACEAGIKWCLENLI